MKAPRPSADFAFESAARLRGARLVAGVDEAGRGPLAGPVVAAAVVLDPSRLPQGLADSKTLSAARRERLFDQIMSTADVAVGQADLDEIDRLNILHASLLAMERAVAGLPRPPDHVLVDGNRLPPGLRGRAEAIVKGDARSLSIAAASIVAKVTRDRIMVDLAQQFPGYGWEENAGYPTPGHLKALLDLGVSAAHRRSFRPVHNILYQDKSVSR
ncbi:MAG: ribonuclease HII [Paracoccaceae bacterium]